MVRLYNYFWGGNVKFHPRPYISGALVVESGGRGRRGEMGRGRFYF
jgi:hypothetical protein